MSAAFRDGLSLHPFTALRPTVDGPPLARRLCPPYDVISPEQRARLLAGDPDNAVGIILTCRVAWLGQGGSRRRQRAALCWPPSRRRHSSLP